MTATLTKPTLTDLIDALLDVALADPDHIYDNGGNCSYTPDEDTPAEVGRCIIGEVVIAKWGAATDDDFITGPLVFANNTSARGLFTALDYHNTDMDTLATEVQCKQDVGWTWADAVTYGIAEYVEGVLTPEQQDKYDRLRAHLNTLGA